MDNKPEGATYFNKRNNCFYKVSSDNPDDNSLHIHKINYDDSECWEVSDFKNKHLNTKLFEKV